MELLSVGGCSSEKTRVCKITKILFVCKTHRHLAVPVGKRKKKEKHNNTTNPIFATEITVRINFELLSWLTLLEYVRVRKQQLTRRK